MTDCGIVPSMALEWQLDGRLACLNFVVHVLNQPISPHWLAGGLLNDTGCELF